MICNEVLTGSIGISKTGEKFIIVERINKKAKIRFLDEFGAEIVRQYTSVKKGAVRNPYEILVHGCGRHGKVENYTHKEKDYWKRLCERYSQGKLPHFNPRWLVLEYWLEDTRKLKDYDLFLTCGDSIIDPFGRFDNIDNLMVSKKNTRTYGVVVLDLFTKMWVLYESVQECALETGYHTDTIYSYCKHQRKVDGYKFFYGKEFKMSLV
ncbi:MAG: hypothetical protein [Malazfec virus 1]